MVFIVKEDDGVSMMYNEKLVQIGSKLNVSGEDIKEVQSHNRRGKIMSVIVGGGIATLSTIAGFLIGMSLAGSNGYPYAVGGFASVAQQSQGKKYLVPSVIITAIVSIIGFLVAYNHAMFGLAIDYGAYKSKRELRVV